MDPCRAQIGPYEAPIGPYGAPTGPCGAPVGPYGAPMGLIGMVPFGALIDLLKALAGLQHVLVGPLPAPLNFF